MVIESLYFMFAQVPFLHGSQFLYTYYDAFFIDNYLFSQLIGSSVVAYRGTTEGTFGQSSVSDSKPQRTVRSRKRYYTVEKLVSFLFMIFKMQKWLLLPNI